MSDLIDRQAAIKAANTALFPKINTAKDAEKALRNLPSAQPERKTGEWQLVRADRYIYRCDVCEKNTFGMSDYCPNCGARMEGTE